jgi:acetolactate decarboxylase
VLARAAGAIARNSAQPTRASLGMAGPAYPGRIARCARLAPARLADVLDERLIRALHVEALRRDQLHAEREPHVLFQASTIGALLAGAYDGDVTFAQLAEHGDLGLGTLNGLDGEMIALDGRFYRADVDGQVNEVDRSARTPFAVLTWFAPSIEFDLDAPLGHDELLATLDRHVPAGAPACAVRIDGSFELVRARSIPRQAPPYRPLAEVVARQHVFELAATDGTVAGFRFPDYSEGIEVSGYHLHFISSDRSRGGHVLECRPGSARVRIDPSTDLHIELPPGIDLSSPDLSRETHDALERVEHSG